MNIINEFSMSLVPNEGSKVGVQYLLHHYSIELSSLGCIHITVHDFIDNIYLASIHSFSNLQVFGKMCILA